MATVVDRVTAVHPLDPLGADEIVRAWEILSAQRPIGPRTRVIAIVLHEPAKDAVLRHRVGDRVERAAFVVGMPLVAVVAAAPDQRAVQVVRERVRGADQDRRHAGPLSLAQSVTAAALPVSTTICGCPSALEPHIWGGTTRLASHYWTATSG